MKSFLLLSLAGFCFLSAAPAVRAQLQSTASPYTMHMAHTPAKPTKPAKPTVAKPSDLPPGVAEGTYTASGKKSVAIHFVTSFIDQQDPRKPTVILLADHPVPLSHWNDEVPNFGPDANALIFWLDKGQFYRCDEIWHGHRQSTSGIYQMKLATLAPNDYSGSATTPYSCYNAKLDVRLHVVVH